MTDSGDPAGFGVATSVHCFNFDTVTRQVRFVVRGTGGDVVSAPTHNIAKLQDFTVSTHFTNVFDENNALSIGETLDQGSIIVLATSAKIVCTAMIVDAASASPNGIALHMMRVNPLAGSQE